MIKSDNKFTKMQQEFYDKDASTWSLGNRDAVVGSFDAHNAWTDYEDFLFQNIKDAENKIAIDLFCGPCRSIVNFNKKFKQIDGVDISEINLKNGLLWCKYNNIKNIPKLYKNNGIDLLDVKSNYYDIIFSTISFQHICVYTIRFNYLKECFRILKQGGDICIQMGFGPGHPSTVGYYEDFYDATGTNGGMDVRVGDPIQLKSDLYKIGFIDFNYTIRPTGPGDRHGNWIFFNAKKP